MHLLLSDKIDVRSAGKYSEPVFDLMRIIPVDARGYAGARELSAAIGTAGRFGASAEKARGPAPHSKESGGAGSVRLKNNSTLASIDIFQRGRIEELELLLRRLLSGF